MDTILVSDFINFVDTAKVIKPNTVFLFSGNSIYATDSNLSHIKYTPYNTPIKHDLMFEFKNSTLFIKLLEVNNSNTILIINNRLVDCNDHSNYIELYNFRNLLVATTVNILAELSKCTNIINYGDVKQDLDFIECISAKSIDGLQLYKKDKYIMSIFTGLLPINKSDKVELVIYDVNMHNFIANFKIVKKKQPIDIYIRYMKLS